MFFSIALTKMGDVFSLQSWNSQQPAEEINHKKYFSEMIIIFSFNLFRIFYTVSIIDDKMADKIIIRGKCTEFSQIE